MALLLYLFVSAGLLLVWKRSVQRVTNMAAVAIVLIPLCFTGGAILRGRVYAPIDLPFATEPLRDYAPDYGAEVPAYNGTLSDLYMQMIPWQSAVRQSLARGEWPLWNPHMLSGTVLAANMQSAPYDPVQLTGFLLEQPDALTFGATMTFFLAVLFAFAFARSLGCGEIASLIGAAGYAFCGMLSFFVQWPLGRVWAYMPLVFLGVSLVVRPNGLRGVSVLTSAFVLTIVSGHPESLLHIVTCGAAWGVFELLRVPASRRRRAVGLAVACGVTALLLTAIALLPFFEAAGATADYSVRRDYYAERDLDVPAGAVLNRAAASLFPFFGGPGHWRPVAPHWEPTTLRAGSIVLLLALLAALVVRRRDGWFFAGLALVAGLAGLNAWPVAELLHDLPLFDIALNERLVFAAAFALSMLAALAADSWPQSRRGALAAAGLLGAATIALAIGSALLYPGELKAGIPAAHLAKLIAADLVPPAIIVLLLLSAVPRRAALLAILGMLLVQRHLQDGATYPALDRRMFYPEVPILKQIRNDPAGPFRIAPLQYSFVPDAAALYRLEDVRGYEAMTLLEYFQLYGIWCDYQPPSFNAVSNWSHPFLSFLNVKYTIGPRTRQPDSQWKLVGEDRESRLFENTRVLPRAFVPARVEYVPRFDGVAFEEMRTTPDFGQVAWLTVPEYEAHPVENGRGKVDIVRAAGGDLLLDVTMERDGWVVASEPAWPGWRAYVDGRRVRPRKANHAFLGVYVPAGRHAVRLRYLPESFTRGRTISAVTLALLVAGLGTWSFRGRTRAIAA